LLRQRPNFCYWKVVMIVGNTVFIPPNPWQHCFYPTTASCNLKCKWRLERPGVLWSSMLYCSVQVIQIDFHVHFSTVYLPFHMHTAVLNPNTILTWTQYFDPHLFLSVCGNVLLQYLRRFPPRHGSFSGFFSYVFEKAYSEAHNSQGFFGAFQGIIKYR
jgi:hypothetical protein